MNPKSTDCDADALTTTPSRRSLSSSPSKIAHQKSIVFLGSPEERKAFERAYAFGRKAPYHELFDVIEDEGAILIDIKPEGKAVNGETVAVKVKVLKIIKCPQI